MVIRAPRSGIVPRIRDDEAERWTSGDELIKRDSVRGVCVYIHDVAELGEAPLCTPSSRVEEKE